MDAKQFFISTTQLNKIIENNHHNDTFKYVIFQDGGRDSLFVTNGKMLGCYHNSLFDIKLPKCYGELLLHKESFAYNKKAGISKIIVSKDGTCSVIPQYDSPIEKVVLKKATAERKAPVGLNNFFNKISSTHKMPMSINLINKILKKTESKTSYCKIHALKRVGDDQYTYTFKLKGKDKNNELYIANSESDDFHFITIPEEKDEEVPKSAFSFKINLSFIDRIIKAFPVSFYKENAIDSFILYGDLPENNFFVRPKVKEDIIYLSAFLFSPLSIDNNEL